ncbi:helix-turn-helix domain-containing protein [Clostridium sp. JNZ J1-5]
MEVLSVGEKIKRARVYKGLTLKDVCGSEISVSKLSCIENGKVTPEDWVLEYIASKLDLSMDYLYKNVEDQINSNLNEILNNPKKDDYEESLKYNLDMAQRFEYYDLAFYIMHLIFDYLLKINDSKRIQELLGEYYDLCNNSSDIAKRLTYYMDVARFFYKIKEYPQAANYFRNVIDSILKSEDKNYTLLGEGIYGEAVCNVMLGNYKEAYDIAIKLQDLFDYIKDKLKKAKMYHMMAILSLRMDNGDFEYYESKSYEMYGIKNDFKAEAIFNYASTMFQIGLKEKAVEYINRALDIYPKEDKEKLVNFMLMCTEELVNNSIAELARELSETTLDYSIHLDNIKFIEKAYYLKSKILQKQNNLLSAEMYMNLSLDALAKFGTKKQIYERYMEMGQMYYDIGSVKEALKYFTLGLNMHKKL